MVPGAYNSRTSRLLRACRNASLDRVEFFRTEIANTNRQDPL